MVSYMIYNVMIITMIMVMDALLGVGSKRILFVLRIAWLLIVAPIVVIKRKWNL